MIVQRWYQSLKTVLNRPTVAVSMFNSSVASMITVAPTPSASQAALA